MTKQMVKQTDTVESAAKELAVAQAEYGRIIRQVKKGMDKKLRETARTALAKKRYARAKLDCLKKGLPVPEPQDLQETKILSEKKKLTTRLDG